MEGAQEGYGWNPAMGMLQGMPNATAPGAAVPAGAPAPKRQRSDAVESDSDEDLRNVQIEAPNAAMIPRASAASSACAASSAPGSILSLHYPHVFKPYFSQKIFKPNATPPPPMPAMTSTGQVGAGACAWPSASPGAAAAAPASSPPLPPKSNVVQLHGAMNDLGLPLLPGVPMKVFWPPTDPGPETNLTVFFQAHWDVELVKALPAATSRAFHKLPAPVQSAVMDVFRFGWSPMSQMADMVHAFTASWEKHHAALCAARVCSAMSAKLVRVSVIHVSSGHGTGVGTAHEAMKLLQMAYAPSGLLPVISRVRHYVTGDTQTLPARIELARCFHDQGLACGIDSEIIRWTGNASEAKAIGEQCAADSERERALTVVLVDLNPFPWWHDSNEPENVTEVEGVGVKHCAALKAWTGHLVQEFAQQRGNVTTVMVWRGDLQLEQKAQGAKHFGAWYNTDSVEYTGVGRPITVFASHVARRPIEQNPLEGISIKELTSSRQTMFIPQPVKRLAKEPQPDGNLWYPNEATTRMAGKCVPRGFAPEWPSLMRCAVFNTDGPSKDSKYLLDLHRVMTPESKIMKGGVAHFLHFLGWGQSSYRDIMLRWPCLGLHYVANGMPKPPNLAATATAAAATNAGTEAWVAQCGEMTLCARCDWIVQSLGHSWEKFCVSDVIARHAAAVLSVEFLGEDSADATCENLVTLQRIEFVEGAAKT